MSMFVILKSKDGRGRANSFERHTNVELPKLENEEINFIQADGDELEFIIAHFSNILLAYDKNDHCCIVQKWFGDQAKFIYFNLHW
jgi:translation elongation factor P/translation initiation factor 5A